MVQSTGQRDRGAFHFGTQLEYVCIPAVLGGGVGAYLEECPHHLRGSREGLGLALGLG